MTVAADPEGISAREILDFIDLRNKRILEVGCGTGRITFPLAEYTEFITAIDPISDDIKLAREKTPEDLEGKIDFIAVGIEDFEIAEKTPLFDLCIFTWSL